MLPGEIEKPSRGVFAVAASSAKAVSPASANSTGGGTPSRVPSEADFYQSFAEWLTEDLDEATVAIPLGGNGLGRKWVTDVKYVRTTAGWLCLAPVLDLFSRRIVGCAMSTVQDGDLSVTALASAMRARGSPRGVLVHSDGGGIYGDEDYLKKLEEHGVRRSMIRKRNP